MKVAERKAGDEIHGGGMVFAGFAGESDDDVSADGGVRQRFANEFDAAGVMRVAIPAMHGAKDAVGAALQRQMKMRRDARFGGDEIDEILRDVDGLDGAEAKAGERGFVDNLANKRVERNARREIAAVAAEVDSAEDDFLRAGLDEAMDFVEDSGGSEAAAASANERNYAVGTAMIAAVLDFESGACANCGERNVVRIGEIIRRSERWDMRGHFFAQDARRRERVGGNGGERNEICGRGRLAHKRGNLALMRIADDPGDAGKRGEFFGSALRVASGGDDASGRILTVDAANGFASFGVRRGGDGTGVEDDNVGGGVGFGGGAALRVQAVANRVGVGLRGAAAEVLDEEGGHGTSDTIILREASESSHAQESEGHPAKTGV